MFRFLIKFKSLSSKPLFAFTTIPIIRQNLNLDSLHPSKIQENFFNTISQISHQEFLTYLEYFAQSENKVPTLWEKIFSKLQYTLDQFSYTELAQVSFSLGQAKKYDEKFWQMMESKFLENIYVDEDNFYTLSLFLNAFVMRGHQFSTSFVARLLEYIDSNQDIKGNDLAEIARLLSMMKDSLEKNPKYQKVLKKVLFRCLQEMTYLDFKGLGGLANALIFSKQMTEEFQKDIIKNLILVGNTVNMEGVKLVYEAFKDKKVLTGDLGGVMFNYFIITAQETNGKCFIDVCFWIILNQCDDQGVLDNLRQRIKEHLHILDGRDSIKIAFCCNKLKMTEENLVKKLRNGTLEVADEILPEELVWVYQGFAEMLQGDKVFWDKMDEVYTKLQGQLQSEEIKIIDSLKSQIKV